MKKSKEVYYMFAEFRDLGLDCIIFWFVSFTIGTEIADLCLLAFARI